MFVPVSAHPGHGRVVGRVDLLEAQVASSFGLGSFANSSGVLCGLGSGGRGSLAELPPDPSGAAAKSDYGYQS